MPFFSISSEKMLTKGVFRGRLGCRSADSYWFFAQNPNPFSKSLGDVRSGHFLSFQNEWFDLAAPHLTLGFWNVGFPWDVFADGKNHWFWKSIRARAAVSRSRFFWLNLWFLLLTHRSWLFIGKENCVNSKFVPSKLKNVWPHWDCYILIMRCWAHEKMSLHPTPCQHIEAGANNARRHR